MKFLKKFLRSDQREDATAPTRRFSDRTLAVSILLLEIATSDDHFSNIEKDHMQAILMRDFQMDRATVEELIAVSEAVRQESIDLWSLPTR